MACGGLAVTLPRARKFKVAIRLLALKPTSTGRTSPVQAPAQYCSMRAQIGTATLSSTLSSVSTLRTRVGYAADNWLFYEGGLVTRLQI